MFALGHDYSESVERIRNTRECVRRRRRRMLEVETTFILTGHALHVEHPGKANCAGVIRILIDAGSLDSSRNKHDSV